MADTGPLWRRALFHSGLLTAGLCVALGAGEMVVRIHGASRTAAPGPEATGPPAVEAGLPELRTVAELVRPNARGIHKGKLFRTNSAGFRGGEVSRQPRPGVFRIVVLGDSYTMGSGVEEREAYPARLEALLNEGPGKTRTEVLNLGLSGLNLEWIVRRLETIGLAHHPDLIVYGFTANDIEGPAYRKTATPEKVQNLFALYTRFANSPSHLLRATWPRILTLRDLLFPGPGSAAHDLRQNYFDNPEAWQDFTGHLDRLREIGEETDVCVHVLIHTHAAQLNWLHPRRAIYEKVGDAAREHGLSVTQTFPAHRGRNPADLRLDFFDTHPNAAGHELLARELAAGLRALPERCWIRHTSD